MSSHCLEVETNQVPAPGSSSTLTISSSKSRHPPWTELLYEVLKHLKALSKDITRNERMCDGCENLMLATKDPVRQRHAAVTKAFSESSLQTLRQKLIRLNGAIHRAVCEGLKTQLNHVDSIRRPEQLLTPSKKWRGRQRAGPVEFALPMVAIPWRLKARSIDWKRHLGQALQDHFKENPARFSAVFDELTTAYKKAVSYSVRENRITQCISYYHYLCHIERRCVKGGQLPGASFAWYDPFSGVESVSYHIDEEKFAALYNAAAVCTHVAAFYENQNGSGVRRACRLYEQAAGLLGFILDCGFAKDSTASEAAAREKSVGHLKDTIRILRDIQLAQAQESLWRCMQQPNASLERLVLSQEAACVATTYREIVDQLAAFEWLDQFPSEWLTVCRAKVLFFTAVAEQQAWLEKKVAASVRREIITACFDTRRLERARSLLDEAAECCRSDNRYAQLGPFLQVIDGLRDRVIGDIEEAATMTASNTSGSSLSSASAASLEDVRPLTAHWAQASCKLLETCRPDDIFQQLGPLKFFSAQQAIVFRETITIAKKEDDSLGFTIDGQHPSCIDMARAFSFPCPSPHHSLSAAAQPNTVSS